MKLTLLEIFALSVGLLKYKTESKALEQYDNNLIIVKQTKGKTMDKHEIKQKLYKAIQLLQKKKKGNKNIAINQIYQAICEIN